ncbi:hypothetical protein POTOM_037584 [Populus tomentosa]|uniref:C2 domain-containing protein n=1 Tax=Populus tomentosa TaxID=118781 RepID=A0A8X7YXL9_POPTO|nr:hypothetical protein POTOM_037584 [Populus tomentosa]
MAMATSLHLNHTFYHRFTPTSHMSRNLNFYRRFSSSFSWKARVLTLKKKHYRGTGHGVFSSSIIKANNTNNTEIDEVSVQEEKENEMERPPFDINLAENVGKREVDAADCKTVYLSESFVREIYDGQLFIKLKKGFDLPAMDPWGTSDPYVVMELDGQVVKSKVKWGYTFPIGEGTQRNVVPGGTVFAIMAHWTFNYMMQDILSQSYYGFCASCNLAEAAKYYKKKKPTWNEDFTVNIKLPPTKNLQIAAWDANLVTPHKRMGNTSIGLESLCDGNLHEVVVELEGMGGGGKLQLESLVMLPSTIASLFDGNFPNMGQCEEVFEYLSPKTLKYVKHDRKALEEMSFMEDGFNEKLISVKVVASLKKALWIVSNIYKLGRKDFVWSKPSQLKMAPCGSWVSSINTLMFVNLDALGRIVSNAFERILNFLSVNLLVDIDIWTITSGKVKYKTFDEIDEEKRPWRLPFVSDFLRKNGFESALKMVAGSETMPARQFVEYAFGQLKSFNVPYVWTDQVSNSKDLGAANSNHAVVSDMPLPSETKSTTEVPVFDTNRDGDSNLVLSQDDNDCLHNLGATEAGEATQSDKQFWKNFADVISQTVAQKLGFSVSLELKWDEFDLLNRIGLQSQKIAEAGYVESGLAIPEGQKVDSDEASAPLTISKIQSSLPEIKKVTQDLLRQTDSVLGAWMVLTTAVSKLNKEENVSGKSSSDGEKLISSSNGTALEDKKSEEMRVLFSTAESAMEAWAMLATSLGHSSFIKSEFEKICFLDNSSTDTQVAIWRDNARKRLIVAFRGTEQVRWKDLRTDLMVVPTGLNPERIGGDFKQEVQVHSGFLSAYDSVRIRIISIIKLLISYVDNGAEPPFKWHVYVTGHSLGGALATLLALELSSSQLVKRGAISVTMYNFGSPRVGNKKFAEVYNQKVKDSWRVVNHRDIVPTVPRLMGYCHVAQPVYLATGELEDALVNLELLKDGYQGDFIGESTPDVVVSEFMKGEKELIEKILQTEINIFRSIRDGSGLMQHMEDFYYITLLENVRSNYQPLERVESSGRDSIPTSQDGSNI